MKKNFLFITLALLSFCLIVSCSNNNQGAKAVGLSVGRVETVFADDAWKYDVVYKSGSSRYISEVIVNLSNGTYRYPSSVKAEILKKDGETWKSIQKDVTGQVIFSESGVYKIKYTSEGMTAETEEFNVYKPGEIIDFYTTKKAYVEGIQMQRTDFSCTYCYKDKNGNIGITSSSDRAWVSYYTRSTDPNSTMTTMLSHDGKYQDSYKTGKDLVAGVVVQLPDTEIYDQKEVPITVVKEEDCDDSFIKNLAYFTKPSYSADHYEFSGSIIKALYHNGSSAGKIDLVKKTDDGVKIAEGYTVKISAFIPSNAPKNDTDAIQALYDKVTRESGWNDISSSTFANKSTSEITGAGYYMIQIFKGEKEITKEDPAFIRISK